MMQRNLTKAKRVKASIQKNSFTRYLKRKHDYTKCCWCNHVIKKNDNYCWKCGTANLGK